MSNKPHILNRELDFLALYKPSGYLSQKTEKDSNELSIFSLSELWRKQAHVLTRVDRPVSGLVLVSLKKNFNLFFQKIQSENKVRKTYLAIIEGKPKSDKGTLRHYLFHNKKSYKSYISETSAPNFQEVNLEYELIKSLDNYSVIALKLNRGKFHQIRAQLAFEGMPIKGDVKYGARRKNKDRSIHLHSYQIDFTDKEDNKKSIIAPLPKDDTLWKLVAEHIDNTNTDNG